MRNFGRVKPWELLIQWGKRGGLTLKQTIEHILYNLVDMDRWREKQDRDAIRQQEEIEYLYGKVTELQARMKLAEEQLALRREGNGQE